MGSLLVTNFAILFTTHGLRIRGLGGELHVIFILIIGLASSYRLLDTHATRIEKKNRDID